jgi:hypothetical protein
MSRETTLALTKRALAPDWREADPPAPAELAEAIAELEAQLPLRNAEPGLDGQMSRLVEDTLRPLGAVIDPRISDEQAKAWRKGMLLALSDLPGPILVKAARRAAHTPASFLADVHAIIRKEATAALDQQRFALRRLVLWREAMERAAMPQPQIEHQPDSAPPQCEIDALNATMRSAGLKSRWRAVDGQLERYEIEKVRKGTGGFDAR